MSRTPCIAANWKMNKLYTEAVQCAQKMVDLAKDYKDEKIDVYVCPPHVDLKGVSNVFFFEKSWIKLGAQNVYPQKSGAFTGEVSPGMLKDLDVEACIVGHSERRTLLSESNEFIAQKIKALCAVGIRPILCVGEPHEAYAAGTTQDFLEQQLRESLAGVTEEEMQQCILAYEPIWAIGTGEVATPQYAQDVCAQLRAQLVDLYSSETADKIQILYGGSVMPGNISLFLDCTDIDGALVGGASLEASSFMEIVSYAIQ